MSRTDAELLHARAGAAAAFRELYERYAERVHAYLLRRTRDPEAAHDLTAETFARVWTTRRRFRDEAGGSAGPWLYGIARNVLLESVRHGRLERDACLRLGVLDRLDRRPAEAVPDERWLDEIDDPLDAALAELPAGQRAAVELRVLDQLEYEEVAAALETTPLAARVRVSRGLAAIRNHVTKIQEATR